MDKFKKVKRILLYKEEGYFFWGIQKKVNRVSNFIVRLFLKFIRNQHRNKCISYFSGKKDFKTNLKHRFGNYAAFEKVIIKEEKEKLIESAEKILSGYYDILGSGSYKMNPINWHTDFKSGFNWPKGTFYLKYKQVDLSNKADVKIPRELSRSHHLLILGQAYLLTKDDKYTIEFINQITHWIDDNPLMYSINWGCTMDVAIRAANWIITLNMFIDSEKIGNKFIHKIITSLYEHGWFINRNLERSFKGAGNHYVADLAGLLLIGLLFKEDEKGKHWYEFSKYALYKEIRTQILPSGIVWEGTTGYIRLVNELFTYSYIFLCKNESYIPNDISIRIKRQFEFLCSITKDDGTVPIIGDNDNGRFLPFSIQRDNDYRYLLTIAAVLFNSSRFKFFSSGFNSDAFSLLGIDSKTKFERIPDIKYEHESKAYIDAGFFIMRKNENYTLCNIAQGKYFDDPFMGASHIHADLLSFELAIGKQTFLVDPGSFIYSGSVEERNLFRSTKMHNTVVIDNIDQYIINPKKLFGYDSIYQVKLNQWESNKNYDLFDAEHHGYLRLKDPVVHRRVIKFDKNKVEWDIVDIIKGKEKHDISIFYHFDIGIDFEIESNNKIYTTLKKEKNILIEINTIGNMELVKKDTWISKSYGIKNKSKSLEVNISNSITPIEIHSKISLI